MKVATAKIILILVFTRNILKYIYKVIYLLCMDIQKMKHSSVVQKKINKKSLE
jgi:hypothetical protein